jgi:hypothetical protein
LIELKRYILGKPLTLILMCPVIAVKLLTMTYAGRLVPELPCPLLLGGEEWKLPHCVANKSKKELKRLYSIKE